MIIGYARTSTGDQQAGLEDQIAELKRLGADEIFHEQVSSVDDKREKLEEAIKFARKGDVFTVTKLDRLARSMRHLIQIQDRLKAKGVSLNILNIKMDTSTPTGEFILNVLGGVAQWERSMMLERQRVGLEKAKREGRCLGRKPTAFEKAADVRRMTADGETPTDIAKALKIGRASVYRILGAEPDHTIKMKDRLNRWGKAAS